MVLIVVIHKCFRSTVFVNKSKPCNCLTPQRNSWIQAHFAKQVFSYLYSSSKLRSGFIFGSSLFLHIMFRDFPQFLYIMVSQTVVCVPLLVCQPLFTGKRS
jgi:hypothetical protein